MRNFKKSRISVIACMLLAVMALTAVFSMNTFAAGETAFTGTQLTLTDGTNIRFVGTLSDADKDGATVVYTIGAGETKTAALTVDANGNFTADVPVGAAEMAETVTAKIMVGDAEKDSMTQSVKAYAETQLTSNNTFTKSLVSELLRYGAEAYKFVNGSASNMLDGLTLSDALTFPAEPEYAYTKDESGTFTKIQLTLTDALRLTLKAGDVAVSEAVKISEFFDGITATSGAASVTASASLYAKVNKDDADTGALVQALYNYAAAVKAALSHVHAMDAGVYDADALTLTYTCAGCSDSYTTEVFVLDQFSAKPIWKGTYRSMNFATDPNALTTYDKGINVPVVDGKVQIIKDAEVYAFNPSKKDTGLFAEGLQTYYTDGTDVNKLAFGFDLTMPSGGFSSAAEGDSKPIVRIGARAGNYPNKVFDNYCAMLKDDKLVFFIAGDAEEGEPNTYITAHTFAPGETANVALVYELSVDGTTTYMTTTAYINGVATADFTVTVDAVTGGFGTTSKSHVHFITEANYYLNTGLNTGYIVDNMYVANDFTGFGN